MKYKALDYFSYKGVKYKGGDILELSEEQASAFVAGYIEPLNPIKKRTSKLKTKSTVTKKTK